MNNQMVRAYLWQAIIRLGFCPASTKDKKNWLMQFGRSIKEFWEIPSYPKTPSIIDGKLKGHIDCVDRLKILLEYSLDSTEKFNVRFCHTHPKNETETLMWIHDVDGNHGKYYCFSPHPFCNHKQERAAMRKITRNDIEIVLDGLFLHPKAHQHIESPISDHNIRIGGGIDNPFLYLFHLRYQLCPIIAKRNAERDRLVDLFSYALSNNSHIAPVTLMPHTSF